MLNKNELDLILAKYNIVVKNYNNYFLSLSHSSFSNEYNSKHENKIISNERIEFLGDAILGFLVAEYLYTNFPDLPEGKLSKIRATYVCEEANAKYAKNIGIDKILILGHGAELGGGRNRPAILSDAFESFLGAVYLDTNIYNVKRILEMEVFPHILALDDRQFIDYKSRLQELIQSDRKSGPKYIVEKQEGPNHNPTFTIGVYLDHLKYGEGSGPNKATAEQEAAKEALSKLADGIN